MRPESLLELPARPVSEFEWEDLLVRVELMLRALRVTLDPIDPADPPVAAILAGLAAREAEVGTLLERAALRHSGESQNPGEHEIDPPRALDPGLRRDDDEGAAPLQTFLRLRQRNFAVLQRRGLDVWEWSAHLTTGETATVYQLLSHLVSEDVRALAALRAVRPRVEAAC